MKVNQVIVFTIIGTFLLATAALAATATQNLNIFATVSPTATLILSTNNIHFLDADPETVTFIPAQENPVGVIARVKTGGATFATLTVLAATDLISGSDTIAISNVTWTATGSGFVDGTMSTIAPVTAASWRGSGNRSGQFNYFLYNSWDYATGNYTAAATYTLSAP